MASETMRRQLVMRPGWALLLLALVVLGAHPRLRAMVDALEQGVPKIEAGDLLVARPGGVGRPFERTVILILGFGPERIFGVVVNRTITFEGEKVFWGGPLLSPTRLLVAQAREAPAGAEALGGGLYFLEGAGAWPPGALRARVFEGYAGWAPGQLEEELERGAWIVRPSEVGLVFGQDDRDTWLVAFGEGRR